MVHPTAKNMTILIGKESTYGTAVSAVKDLGLIQNVNVRESNQNRVIGAVGTRSPQDIRSGNYDLSGSIDLFLQHGRLLEYIFGTVGHATTGSDTVHTFTEAATLPSLTMEVGSNLSTADVTNTYAGVKIVSGTITLEVNGTLSAAADWIGKTVANTASTTSAVIDTLAPLTHYEGSVSIAASPRTDVQRFELRVNNQTDKQGQIGARLIQDASAHEAQYEFTMTMAFTDDTEYERFLGATAPLATTPAVAAIIFSATNGVALGSGKREFSISLSNCVWDSHTTPVSLGNFVVVELTGQATGYSSCTYTDDIPSASW